MDLKEFLQNKRLEKTTQSYINDLVKIYNGMAISNITKDMANLGIVLLGSFLNFYNTDKMDSAELNRFKRKLVNILLPEDENTKKGLIFSLLSTKAKPKPKQFKALLVYLLGKNFGELAYKAWYSFPNYPYQKGVMRRSFRSPDNKNLALDNQINFISSLFRAFKYNFSIHESAIYHSYLSSTDYLAYSCPYEYIWLEAINDGDEELFKILIDIVYNRHDTGKVTRSIIKTLLMTDRPEAWKAVADLLLSAQRQEGLRQSILESLDETSHGAMEYIINLIVDENLTRFSSVARAIDVWTGLGWESDKSKSITRTLSLINGFLKDPDSIDMAICSKDNLEIYTALWVLGIKNIELTYPYLHKLFDKGDTEKCVLVLYFITQCNIDSLSYEFALKAIENDSLHVVSSGLSLLKNTIYLSEKKERSTLFEKLEKFIEVFPKKKKEIKSVVFSWHNIEIDRSKIYSCLISIFKEDKETYIERVVSHILDMTVEARTLITSIILPGFDNYYYYEPQKIEKPHILTDFQRKYLFMILNDKSSRITNIAFAAIELVNIRDDEVSILEEMLKRKNGELRNKVIKVLLNVNLDLIKKSINRLLCSTSFEQRLAALDLLNELFKDPKNKKYVAKKADEFGKQSNISAKEDVLLKNISADKSIFIEYTKDNGYGLYEPANITVNELPIEKTVPSLFSMKIEKINKLLIDLQSIFLEHKDFEYETTRYNCVKEKVLLGNEFSYRRIGTIGEEVQYHDVPLSDVWDKWYENSELIPTDLLLIDLLSNISYYKYHSSKYPKLMRLLNNVIVFPKVPKIGNHQWNNPIPKIIQALQIKYTPDKIGFIEKLLTHLYHKFDKKELDALYDNENSWDRSKISIFTNNLLVGLYNLYSSCSREMDNESFKRFWVLDKWKFANTKGTDLNNVHYKNRSSLFDVARAYELKLITIDELYSRILTADGIREISTKPRIKNQINYFERFPFLVDMYETSRDRILEIELKRGESSTPVSTMAQNIQSLCGIENFVQILNGLGKENIARGYYYSWRVGERTKNEILSTLLKRCYPAESDTQKQFNNSIENSDIKEKRLIEASIYSPQWIEFISNNLKWKGLDSGVWWLHAHTNSHHDSETESHISRYSPVDMKSFKDGAVDIDWFKSAYKKLGEKRWKLLYSSAKYVNVGNGHTRAKLYSDVILSKITIDEIYAKVKDKRNQDYLRVLGLAPLNSRRKSKDILERYQYLQQFKKESKQFGSQRQASESLAITIAMENLARTAGYPDPIRLTWAMETSEAESILKDCKPIIKDDVKISLTIDENGQAGISVINKGKAQKSIPAKFKKDKQLINIKQSVKILKNQFKRAKHSLEAAMVNGDEFNLSECKSLMKHPVISPLLGKLVFTDDASLGFFDGEKLVSYDGERIVAGKKLRLAHCSDLYSSNKWTEYQNYCFENKLVQPYKQIFRELYIPTEDELADVSISRRYSGHQVQPGKTLALLKSRGWVVDQEEGLQKVYHKENIIAKIYAEANWFTPADIESPTLETVQFMRCDNYGLIPFKEISPLIFSEIMRDLDLVVSIAHVGDLDPEESHSSIEMRAAIVLETANLYKLENIKVDKSHVLIKGSIADYSIHLGSGLVFKQPAVSLSVLAVHSQHRGKIFLPFIDDDPKTAEIVSKVLMFSNDGKIQDPTILQQIT